MFMNWMHGCDDGKGRSAILENKFAMAYKTLLSINDWKLTLHMEIRWYESLKPCMCYQVIWNDWRSSIGAMISNMQYQEF